MSHLCALCMTDEKHKTGLLVPGKVRKILEFKVEIFKALNSLENDYRYGFVWNPEKL